jgi:Protein of unknown function (DUF4236)
MAWSFRKRVKVIPGVHLNFSKSGISTSIGFKGASVTIGKSGTYLNTSIPGLGLSNRQKMSGGSNQPQVIPSEFEYLAELPENIFSADVQEITSQDMQGIKQAIFAARQERQELRNDIIKVKSTLTYSKVKLGASYALLYGLINKKISEKIKEDIKNQKEALAGLRDCLENCYVKIEIDFDDEIRTKYNRIVSTFKQLTTARKIWDVTSAHSEDRVRTRSAASTVVQKKEVKFGINNLPEIKTEHPALHFRNANGADLFFYPTFVVMYQNKENFAMIGYNELEFYFSSTRFVEEGSVPNDSKVIDKTWKKVNKNGTPDKRFKGNYQIPIVRYGTINLRTNTGLNEEYSFSNYEFAEAFGHAFSDYQLTIKKIHAI